MQDPDAHALAPAQRERLLEALVTVAEHAISLCGQEAPLHVAHPVEERSTLFGSELGALVWASDAGKFLGAQLATILIAASAEPEPSMRFVSVEIRERFASFLRQALEASLPLMQFADASVDFLARDLARPPRGGCVQLLRGPRVQGEGFSFGDYLEVRPATEPTASENGFLSQVGRNWHSLPADTSALVTTRVYLVERGSPLPALDVAMQSLFVQHNLMRAVWLTTAHRADWIVRWFGEYASFPIEAMHEARSHLDGARPELGPVQPLDAGRMLGAFNLMQAREWLGIGMPPGHEFDFATSESLRAAFYLVDAADRTVDGAQLLVQTYSAIEGLLTAPGESDSKVLSRGPALMSSTMAGRKRLRLQLDAMRVFRNTVAHGNRPSWDEAQLAAGLSKLDGADLIDRGILERELNRVCLELLRCAFGGFLWLAVQTTVVDDRACSIPRLPKADILATLDSAAWSPDSNQRLKATETLATLVPDWLRDPLGRTPETS